jgi:dethiobiotin synthetase
MIVVVTGTGTDVGKTWFTAATIVALRADGHAVAARKPVQSFAPGDPHPTDADVLADATGEAVETVCPRHRWLAKAVAPPMAAAALGLDPFTIADLATEVRADASGSDDPIVFVEGAGGARSPIADDGDTVALAHALAADHIVIVADAGLGTINAVRLTVAALNGWNPIVALNRYDETDSLHVANRDWLTNRDGYEVVTDPAQLAGALTLRGSPRARS